MSFSFTALFLFCATIVFMLGWLGLLPFESHKKRTHKWLYAHGKPVVAKVDRVTEETTKHGSAVWTIFASWADPIEGTHYSFESPPLNFDPGAQIQSGVIPVLVDPDNPRRYAVDVNEIRMSAGH